MQQISPYRVAAARALNAFATPVVGVSTSSVSGFAVLKAADALYQTLPLPTSYPAENLFVIGAGGAAAFATAFGMLLMPAVAQKLSGQPEDSFFWEVRK